MLCQVVDHFHRHLELWRQQQPGGQIPAGDAGSAYLGCGETVSAVSLAPPSLAPRQQPGGAPRPRLDSLGSEIGGGTAFDEACCAGVHSDLGRCRPRTANSEGGSSPAASPDVSRVHSAVFDVVTGFPRPAAVPDSGAPPAAQPGWAQPRQPQPLTSPFSCTAAASEPAQPGGSATPKVIAAGAADAMVSPAGISLLAPLSSNLMTSMERRWSGDSAQQRMGADACQAGSPAGSPAAAVSPAAQQRSQQEARREWLRQRQQAVPPTARYFRTKRLPWATSWVEGLKAFGQTLLLPMISISPCNGVIV